MDRRAASGMRSRVGRSTTSRSDFGMPASAWRARSGFSTGSSTIRNGRRKGFESARRAMDLVSKIGGKRLAAPPAGATDRRMADMLPIAERYRSLLELGDQCGVVPQVEVWGGSKTLSRLGEAAQVAIEAHHPKACILADVYHLYRGGSGFDGVTLLGRESIHVFHFNDYPADPPREKATDADRVYPGDGVAPLKQLLRNLASGRFPRHAFARAIQSQAVESRPARRHSNGSGEDEVLGSNGVSGPGSG